MRQELDCQSDLPVDELRFDNRVVLITGAGRGLGRSYALLLGSLGAAVVVNDLGGDTDGREEGNPEAALNVCAEINNTGGKAVANCDDVSTEAGASSCVSSAVREHGRLDVVINNAGINPTSRFVSTPRELLDRVLSVHIGGTWGVTQAAWPQFIKQGYGRIIVTSSGSIYQGFGNRPTYVLAKSSLFGLVRDLAVEGAPHGIVTNGLLPGASTRMLSPGQMPDSWTPEAVAPVVAVLAHEACPVNGEMIETRGGEVRRVFMAKCRGIVTDGAQLTPEYILSQIDTVMDPQGAEPGQLVDVVSGTGDE